MHEVLVAPECNGESLDMIFRKSFAFSDRSLLSFDLDLLISHCLIEFSSHHGAVPVRVLISDLGTCPIIIGVEC